MLKSVLFCWLFVISGSSQVKFPVEFKVKSSYSSMPINFEIINNTDTSISYFISVEAFFDKRWHQAETDIDTTSPDKVAIIKKLKPRETKKLQFASRKIPIMEGRQPPKSGAEKFRFVLHHFFIDHNNVIEHSNEKLYYSSEFKIDQLFANIIVR